jgi:hypothetical protein
MTPSSCPPFEEAVSRLQAFLASKAHPTDIAWVFRDDLTSNRRGVWVRLPLHGDNGVWAGRCYEIGLKKGLGIWLQMLFVLGNVSYCCVWFPVDEADAEYAMLAGLKLSVPETLPVAHPGKAGLAWWLRSTFNSLQGAEGLVHEVLPRSEQAFLNRL